jgi:hypothetical protein
VRIRLFRAIELSGSGPLPIEVDSEIRDFSEGELHRLAERVIGFVFDIHNDLG